MNLLLRRVSDHASHSYYNVARDQEVGRTSDEGRFDWRDCVGQCALYYLVRNLHKVAMLLCAFEVIARASAAGFRGQAAGLFQQAADATDRDGSDTSASRDIFSFIRNSFEGANISIAVSLILEAAVLLLEAFAFLLFFPACIVMFRRVERRLGTIIHEMSLRSDHGNVFLPFEFSPPAAGGSQTQVELPIVEAFFAAAACEIESSSKRFSGLHRREECILCHINTPCNGCRPPQPF
jgi:hypothetical protein